jgi:hypothetical protein
MIRRAPPSKPISTHKNACGAFARQSTGLKVLCFAAFVLVVGAGCSEAQNPPYDLNGTWESSHWGDAEITQQDDQVTLLTKTKRLWIGKLRDGNKVDLTHKLKYDETKTKYDDTIRQQMVDQEIEIRGTIIDNNNIEFDFYDRVAHWDEKTQRVNGFDLEKLLVTISFHRKVCGRKQWQDAVLKKAGITWAQLDQYEDFTLPNQEIMAHIYGYYAQVFQTDPARFKWAGMAKLAGGSVWGALKDTVKGRIIVPGVGADRTSKLLEGYLLAINKDIFLDLAWQHEAYIQKGIAEMRCLAKTGGLDPTGLQAWEKIDHDASADASPDDVAAVNSGNEMLLRHEQQQIAQPGWLKIKDLGIRGPIAYLSKSPIPSGKQFLEFVNEGRLDNFPERWQWIEKDMYPKWIAMDQQMQLKFVNMSLEDLAARKGFGDP